MAIDGEVPTRRLDWPDLHNARDLGGLPTPDGPTRPGRIVRSDDLGRLTAAGRQALFDYGITTIIDLRGPVELRKTPPPLADHSGYRNLSFLNETAAEDRRFDTVADTYIWLLDAMAARVGVILQAIAGAPPGGVLVHCFAGKDRTGLVSALLLSTAGVYRDGIAEDYALSHMGLQPLLDEWLAAESDSRAREDMKRRFPCHPETMVAVLDHLDERYDGVDRYLLAIGVDARTQEGLRERLLGDQGLAAQTPVGWSAG